MQYLIILQIPGGGGEITTSDVLLTVSSAPSEAAITRIVFYTVSTLPLILYITLIVTVLAYG